VRTLADIHICFH